MMMVSSGFVVGDLVMMVSAGFVVGDLVMMSAALSDDGVYWLCLGGLNKK